MLIYKHKASLRLETARGCADVGGPHRPQWQRTLVSVRHDGTVDSVTAPTPTSITTCAHHDVEVGIPLGQVVLQDIAKQLAR
jgi:hypothetical protein